MSDFEQRIAALSPEQREVLIRRMRERGGPAAGSPPAPERPRLPDGPVDRFAPVPMTDFQEVLWLGRSGIFDAGGCGSNVYIEQELEGSVWPFAASLTAAVNAVIARHELLRTIVLPDGRLQLLAEVPRFEVEVEDLSGRSEDWIEERLRRVRDRMRYAKRSVERWPLFDLALSQINGGRLRLHARFEAILIDGAARAVLIEELGQLMAFPERDLPPLEVSFLDYARALAAFRSTATYDRSRAYWLSKLPSLPPPPVLPLARPLTPGLVPRIVKRQPEILALPAWQDFSRRARQAGLSPTSALPAAFAEVLRLWSARPDFVLGCGGAYKPEIHPQMPGAVGSFTIIHLLAAHDGPGTFQERARQLQARITADLDHQEFSGHQVLREYNRRHRTGARALLPVHFNSVVEYGSEQATPASGDEPPQAGFAEIEMMISLPQALILWVATENDRGGLELVSQAVEEVFPEGFILDLIEAYRGLLARLAAEDPVWSEERPAQRVGDCEPAAAELADLAGTLGYGAHPRFVESALESYPAVQQAIVAWHEDATGPGRLVAWILPRDGHGLEEEELRCHLRTTLPESLVPAAFVFLDGPVDRTALPEPPPPPSGAWGELENEVASLWEEILGRRPAALTDDFFFLGGDSVSAVRLLNRALARWGRRLDPGALFARPSLAAFTDAVRPLEPAAPRETKREEPVPEPSLRTSRKKANVFFFHPPLRPFSGSCAIVNREINEALAGLGYEVHGVYGQVAPPADADVFVPLEAVGKALQARGLPPASLTVHCDFGLQLSPVRRRGKQKNVVFFHGLAGAPSEWAGNPAIDRYWGNSAYMREVIQSLLALPDWRHRQLLDPRAFSVVSHLTLALPCLEEPGALQAGSRELPRRVQEAIDQDDVLGHAVTAEKIDVFALASILLHVNRLAQERGLDRRFRVCVAETLFRHLQAALSLPADRSTAEAALFRDNLRGLGLTLSDLLVPLPVLAQPALFELLRACRFGLFYNTIPESFGFYALESVVHGCPLYTNGIGNLRHLLPAGHGIHVEENASMGFGDPAAYLPAAEALYRDTVTDPAGTEERCRRGAEFIRRRYNRESFRRDVATEIDRLGAKPEACDFDSLTVRLSPLVRLWSPATCRALTDHSPRQLSETERDLAEAALGRPCGEILQSTRERDIEILQRLFQIGILALTHPGSSTSDSRTSQGETS